MILLNDIPTAAKAMAQLVMYTKKGKKGGKEGKVGKGGKGGKGGNGNNQEERERRGIGRSLTAARFSRRIRGWR
jgi:hypothetical protein